MYPDVIDQGQPIQGAIPGSVVDGMEAALTRCEDEDLRKRFREAVELYRNHYQDDELEPVYRKELASCYIEAIPAYLLEPWQPLASIHWRAIDRCAKGQPYGEEERTRSPFQLLSVHTKEAIRVSVTNGNNYWKILKIWVSRGDGSLHCVNHVEQLISKRGNFHYTYHASGAVHDSNQQGKKRFSAPYWPDFRELECAPVNGVGLSPRNFYRGNPSLVGIVCPMTLKNVVSYELPMNAKQFYFEMWIGKPESLSSISALRNHGRLMVLSDKVVGFRSFKLASFLDPKDGYEFDIGFGLAMVIREDDWF